MTNQTVVFSAPDFDHATGVANVTDKVNDFIRLGAKMGYMNFNIRHVVTPVLGATSGAIYYTVQVDYYDPSVFA